MTLFNPRLIKKLLKNPLPVPGDHLVVLRNWASSIRDKSIHDRNEIQLEGDFKSRIVERVLGYTAFGKGIVQTVQAKQPMGSGTVDLALGEFGPSTTKIVAPFELKGADTRDLDAPMPGRKISPVQQAWQYANAVPGVQWVLVTNLIELRFYAFGEGNQNYEAFDLSKIDEPAEYARFMLLLSARTLLGGATTELLQNSKEAEEEISAELYADYRLLRETLIEAVDEATGRKSTLEAISTTQKVLDRVLFIAFAEDSMLLPSKVQQAGG
jgi:hypothetical protein